MQTLTTTLPRPRPRRACRITTERPTAPGGKLTTVEASVLWQRFKRDGDRGARERLVLGYAPLVNYVAGKMGSALPSHVDKADLVSYGLGGLIDAIDRFELDREIRFESYAIMRIKGAILDELRTIDWLPRSLRARGRQIERASAKLEHALQRRPTERELAAEIGISVDELNAALIALSQSAFIALDAKLARIDTSGDHMSLLDSLPDPGAPDPAAILDQSELKDRIAAAVARLPERERLVIALYYYDGLNLKEIGQIIGVTESRISQLHTRAILHLRGVAAAGLEP